MTNPDTLTRPHEVTTDSGDHERFAHMVPADGPPPAKSGAEKVTEARVLGTPVVALCGKTWVPSRDPQRFPVCPDCKRIFDEIGFPGVSP